jgi:hypothetical protein
MFLYILVAGIYPKYSRFVKGMKELIIKKERIMTSWQEGARKDIERAFGILQSKFQWIARPIHLLSLSDISNRVAACLILHNILVSDRIMDGMSMQDITLQTARRKENSLWHKMNKLCQYKSLFHKDLSPELVSETCDPMLQGCPLKRKSGII